MPEIELKFLLGEKSAARIWPRVRASGLASAAPRSQILRAIYWDTPGHDLRKAGIALRVRREGRRWVQTVKSAGALHGGLSIVTENETSAPGGLLRVEAIENAELRDRIAELCHDAALSPICETIIRRTAGEIVSADGTRAELAVDAGEIRAGNRSETLREMEIELLEGEPKGLFDIAKLLLPAGEMRFSHLSKAARGYLLATDGVIEQPIAPRYATEIPLDRSDTVEQAGAKFLRDCAAQIDANILAVAKLDDPEAAHQLRVGLRRLRSALLLLAPAFGMASFAELADEARWLGRETGRLRDLEVVAHELVGPEAARHPDEACLEELRQRIDDEAARARISLRGHLSSQRARIFLIDLARFVETRGWLSPVDLDQSRCLGAEVTGFARQALNKRWKKARKKAGRIEQLSREERHELRKELKKLRYAVEFFSPLFPSRRVKPLLARLKRMQDVFGALNDAATVRTILAVDGPFGDHARATGWVLGATETRAAHDWEQARELWKELTASRRFWA